MSEHQLTQVARQFFEESLALNQVMKALPQGAQIKVLLDGRLSGLVLYDGAATRFSPQAVKKPDFEVDFSAEALRRLGQAPPSEITELSRELLRESLAGQVKWKTRLSASELRSKGYLKSLRDLGPALQGEAFQALMMWLGTASMKFEELKGRLLRR